MPSRSIQAILLDLDGVLVEDARAHQGDGYAAQLPRERPLADRQVLERMALLAPLAVLAPDRSTADAQRLLARCGWGHLFPVVAGVDTPTGEADLLSHTLQVLANHHSRSLHPSKVVYVSHNLAAIRAAQKAHLLACGVVPPDHDYPPTKRALLDAGADVVLSSVNDLLTMMEAFLPGKSAPVEG